MKNESAPEERADRLDDPRLTAYVLGELAPDERDRLEQELRDDPALAREVQSIAALTTGLSAALGAPSAPGLDGRRRARILRAARAPEARTTRSRWPRRLAIAASVLVLTGGAAWYGTKLLGFGARAKGEASPFAYWLFDSEVEPTDYTGSEGEGRPPANSSPELVVADSSPGEISRSKIPSSEYRPVETGHAGVRGPAKLPGAPSTDRLDALGYGGSGIDRTSVPSSSVAGATGPVATPEALEALDELGYNGGAEALKNTPSGATGGTPIGVGGAVAHRAAAVPSTGRVATRLGGGGHAATGRDGRFQEAPGTESYDSVSETPFRDPRRDPLSTFSIDVDTASYANVRRFLSERQLPPADAVRIEEFVNYFAYSYPEPRGKAPFSVNVDSASCPWEPSHRLVRIGLKGRAVDFGEPRTKNLVFLVDVSGSMNDPAKLPLVQKSLRLLVNELRGEDRVALVVYAGNSGLVLPPTQIEERARILDAIDRLQAGGSTNGGSGIQLAYATALEHFATGGVNRVILATDGDFNVGITDRAELLRLIEEKAKSGVFLSVLGYGTGNLKDATMEQLADHGNGNYAYVDSLAEARKVLVREMGATLETIAKDVKIQVEFNPAQVGAWRLVGYENRLLAARDFNDDKKDAGEIGAGHTVTALYEIVPAGMVTADVDPLRYQAPAERIERPEERGAGELLTVKLRYKEPSSDTSELLSLPLTDHGLAFEQAGADFRFAASVAAFGMCLRRSEQRGSATFEGVHRWAETALGEDPHGDRREFLKLVDLAAGLSGR